jgi:hypothetical protein
MNTLIAPQWVDLTPQLVTPWKAVPGSQLQWMVDAWGRAQLAGEVYYPGGNPPDRSVIFQCPPGTIPVQTRTVTVVEDVVPARFYRVDINIDGSIRLRFPLANSTGQLFLDNVSWIVPMGTSPTQPPPAGGNYLRFMQPIPTDPWIIVHNFGYWPLVQVFDEAGDEVQALVSEVTASEVKIKFDTGPTVGVAILE